MAPALVPLLETIFYTLPKRYVWSMLWQSFAVFRPTTPVNNQRRALMVTWWDYNPISMIISWIILGLTPFNFEFEEAVHHICWIHSKMILLMASLLYLVHECLNTYHGYPCLSRFQRFSVNYVCIHINTVQWPNSSNADSNGIHSFIVSLFSVFKGRPGVLYHTPSRWWGKFVFFSWTQRCERGISARHTAEQTPRDKRFLDKQIFRL